MTKYYYDLYCEAGYLHSSDTFNDYDEAVAEAEADIAYEESLEPERESGDYYYEIHETKKA